MKLPKNLKIGPYNYKVLHKKKVEDRGVSLYGHILYGPQTIEVESGLSRERTLAIFMHEAVHGLDEAWCIGLSEKQVKKLGVGLAQVMLDNDLYRETADDVAIPEDAT